MLDWPYAQLVVDAQEAGGPEAFQNLLIATGIDYGKKSMCPWIAASFSGGMLLCWGVSKLIKAYKQQKLKKAEALKRQIIDEVSCEVGSRLIHSKRKIKNLVIINTKS